MFDLNLIEKMHFFRICPFIKYLIVGFDLQVNSGSRCRFRFLKEVQVLKVGLGSSSRFWFIQKVQVLKVGLGFLKYVQVHKVGLGS